MKSILLAIVMLASVSSFGIMAPKGEYLVLACKSNQEGRDFSLNVVMNTKNKAIKMVVVAEGQEDRVYTNVKQEVSSRVGGPTTYSAKVPAGYIYLEYNATTAPSRGGRKALLVSAVYGKATQTQMLCSRVMY